MMIFALLIVSLLVFAPAAPIQAQSISFTQLGSLKVPADTVEISGSHAYVAGGKTITIVDLSNPAAPKGTSAYSFPEQVWSFRIAGSTAYVAANFFGLGILDVSDPYVPRLRNSIKTPGQAKAVALLDTKVLVADHMSGIDIIDVATVEKPVSLGAFFVEGYARDVAASGGLGYAVDSPTGLYVIDPAKPEKAVGELQSASTPQSVEVMERAPGQPPIVVVAGGGALQIYDVSKPSAPVRVATFRTPGGRPTRVAFKGSMAYVADGREGLQVVDLSTPAKPVIVGSFKTPAPARDVAVSDSLIVVAIGAGEGTEEILVLRQQ